MALSFNLLVALALALLLSAFTGAAAQRCSQVPLVDGVDQSPSDPSHYGKCVNLEKAWMDSHQSHWCKFGQLGMVSRDKKKKKTNGALVG